MTCPSDKIFRVFGPPGTGKTTRLLNEVDRCLERDVPAHRIGFFAFTRKAAIEARTRARERFNLTDEDLPNFRTLHSFCYRHSGIAQSALMGSEHWKELQNILGFTLRGATADPEEVEDIFSLFSPQDEVLNLAHVAAIRKTTLREAYDNWSEAHRYPWPRVEYIAQVYEDYRKTAGVFDFTDMLRQFVRLGRGTCPTFDTIFVDEAQDLSALQWDVVNIIAEKSDRVIVAGDDDQAIYKWAGADVEYFLGLGGATETLDQSWRVPSKVHRIAQRIADQITHRYPKKYMPQDRAGEVHHIYDPTTLLEPMRQGTWLVLAQCWYMLDELSDELQRGGFVFEKKNNKSLREAILMAINAWMKLGRDQEINGREARRMYEYMSSGDSVRRGFKKLNGLDDDDLVSYETLVDDFGLLVPKDEPWFTALDRLPEADRAYLKAAEDRGESFNAKPRITLSTIHGAKGGEADNVVLFQDVSRRSLAEAEALSSWDDLHRTFYVGVTRTREKLFLVEPRSPFESYTVDSSAGV